MNLDVNYKKKLDHLNIEIEILDKNLQNYSVFEKASSVILKKRKKEHCNSVRKQSKLGIFVILFVYKNQYS